MRGAPEPAVLIATKNRHKAAELGALFAGVAAGGVLIAAPPGPDWGHAPLKSGLAEIDRPRTGLIAVPPVLSLADWEAGHRVLPEPPEGADSFEANALAKAEYYARATNLPALADDSGLSVIALDGAPGVLSARYGGPGLDDGGRCRLLLEALAGVHDRRAFFTSVLALARPDGAALLWRGELHGLITREPRGSHGFGYDPIFFHPESGCALAQLTAEAKNRVSHRARAARAFQADAFRIEKFLRF